MSLTKVMGQIVPSVRVRLVSLEAGLGGWRGTADLPMSRRTILMPSSGCFVEACSSSEALEVFSGLSMASVVGEPLSVDLLDTTVKILYPEIETEWMDGIV